MLNKFFLPPDVFIRHWLVAREIRKGPLRRLSGESLLDVGGSLAEFRKFIAKLEITTADVVAGADVVYNGQKLPLDNASFDYVVSVDTLEHIPPEKRLGFVNDLVRVAKQRVVIIAPFASMQHDIYEKNLILDFKKSEKKIPVYLTEHRKHGLISLGQLIEIGKSYPTAIYSLAGLVWLDKLNFAVHMFEVNPGKINRVIYILKFIWNLVINLISSLMIINPDKNTASRVIIVIDKYN
ncbi:class I SAM-dependent methyltransferase [Candidatus Collierbacteria bacterium]|nr:class I SAM-dependent methyltransferase [Candidatus Collierbacteria bacterium]